MQSVDWSIGEWINPPTRVELRDDQLLVWTERESDLWRVTSYGFIHDSGHALVTGIEDGQACEVTIEVDYESPFDQAGLLLWSDDSHWVKAGIELTDGQAHIGAVVTNEVSDWSATPAPQLAEGPLVVRMSRSGDALTIRARKPDGPWQLVRLAPIDPARHWRVGPYAASPSRAGLLVTFTRWQVGPADLHLHD